MGPHLIHATCWLCEVTHPDQMSTEQETAAMAPFSTSCNYGSWLAGFIFFLAKFLTVFSFFLLEFWNKISVCRFWLKSGTTSTKQQTLQGRKKLFGNLRKITAVIPSTAFKRKHFSCYLLSSISLPLFLEGVYSCSVLSKPLFSKKRAQNSK